MPKTGGSTVEEHRDTGRIFDNVENDNQHTARKSRWNGRLFWAKNSRSRISPNGCYIEYEPKGKKKKTKKLVYIKRFFKPFYIFIQNIFK